MKHLLTCVVGFMLSAVVGVASGEKKAALKIEGRWLTIGIVDKGERVSAEEVEMISQVLVFKDGKYTDSSRGERTEAGTYKIDATKNPATIDFTVTDGSQKGKMQLGILKMDRDTVTLAIADHGSKERPKDFDGTGDGWILILKRHKVSSPIIKNDAALPVGARLQLGKLAGFRYAGLSENAIMSANGKLIAVADFRGAVTIVSTETGGIVHAFRDNRFTAIANMAFSADNSTLAVQNLNELSVWDIADGKRLLKSRIDGIGRGLNGALSLSADGKIVGIALERLGEKVQTGEVRAIEVATGKTIATFECLHTFGIGTVLAPDGKTMLSYGQNFDESTFFRTASRTIHVWDLVNAKELRKIKVKDSVQCVAFAPDGKTIAAVVFPFNLMLIDVATGKETRRFAGECTAINGGLLFSRDGARLGSFDRLGACEVWEVAGGKRVALGEAPMAKMVAVAFPGKDRVVAMGMLDKTLIWWEASAAKASPFDGQLAAITAVAFSADGKEFLTAGADRRVMWRDTATGKELRQFPIPGEDRFSARSKVPAFVALAAKGTHAAVQTYPSRSGIQLWDLKNARAIREFRLTNATSLTGLRFSPDGSKFSVAGINTPVRVWNTTTGQEVYAMPMTNGKRRLFNTRATISPDGITLVMQQVDLLDRSRPVKEIVLWDLAEKKELRRITDPAAFSEMNAVEFSIDGKLLAVPDNRGGILLYHTATGHEGRKLMSAARTSTLRLAFSADGRFIAAGSTPRVDYRPTASANDDIYVEIWEIASGLKREQFKGHVAGVTCLAFSPDGATLATGSADTTALLWDIAGKNTKVVPFAAGEIPNAWKSLTGADAAVSVTIRRLVHSPATVDFLKQNFRPARLVEVDKEKLAKAVADLESGDFKARASAVRDLKVLGPRAEAALKKSLAGNLFVEGRRRIQALLDALERKQLTPEELQAVRGVEILERIGTPEARACLTTLSKGDPFERCTQDANSAARRMEHID